MRNFTKTVGGGALENPDIAGAEGAKDATVPNLSGKRTEQYILYFNVVIFQSCFSAALFFWRACMQAIFDGILSVVETVNMYLSDYILLFLLVSVGLFYTVKTKFVQVRCFGEGMKQVFGGLSFKKDGDKGGLSSFQALATAIAAQVGTGNIIGACGAIIVGGPGAIFWMWVIAFFGMATIYSEAVLAQQTKEVDKDGNIQGGPVYYIRRAFKGTFGKILAGFFAVAIILALGCMGAMVQSNSIASAINTASGGYVPVWAVGIVLAVICAFIFIGGIKRIASVVEKVVPIMAIGYILIAVVILCINITRIPETLGMIFKYAFMPNAIVGGGIGFAIKQALSQGAKRGLFSNEAGMGSTPHAHAQANVKTPHEQGVVAMIGVFIDTFIVLTMTALVVISTLYTGDGMFSGFSVVTEYTVGKVGINSSNLMQTAIGQVFGSPLAGNIIVAVCLSFFAFTTIIGWNFFGKQNVQYLFGKKATVVYSVIAIAFIFLGSCLKNDLVWGLMDMFNNLMVIPNVLALFVLSAMVAGEVKRQMGEKKELKAQKKAAKNAK